MEIWSDVVCPWCYIGKRRFEAALARFEHADEVEVRWRSYELDPQAPQRRSGTMGEHIAAKYGMRVDQANERLEQMNRLAAAEGLVYDLAHTQGGNTFDAHRLAHLGWTKDADTGVAIEEALFRTYFTELKPIGDHDVLTEAGVGVGLSRQEVAEVLASGRFADDVRHDEREAAALGCTGVPFFVIDRGLAVPGAQDPDVFLATLRRARERSSPSPDAGNACTDGACAV